MSTTRAIIDALATASEAEQRIVLATVVRISGSSYGGVGTRMVIRGDGTTIGIVSGGCLESDLAEHAREVHRTGVAKVVSYDTRADDDAAWGLGLGCNGLIDVFLEPLDPPDAGALAVLLEQAIDSGDPGVLATVISSSRDATSPSIGAHALIQRDTVETTGDWGTTDLLDPVVNDSRDAFTEQRKGLIREYADTSVAFEVVMPSIRLVICGNGPDVVPLVRFATELGWNVAVVDHRPLDHAHPERFPGAVVVECAEPDVLGDAVALTAHTAGVVMSHNYARDLGYMRALLASEVAYIGMLGPRARTERMLAEINASGENIAVGERLFAPVGLDIGGEGPDGIALSIVSEVSARMTGVEGGSLRDRNEPLHSPSRPAAPKA